MTRLPVIVAGVVAACSIAATGFALSPEEIVLLREAGVDESVIRIMIEQSRPGVSEVEDESGNRHMRYSTGAPSPDAHGDRSEAEKVERAWRMLRDFTLDIRSSPCSQ